MRSMARVERFLERLVERPTARVFRARLQPLQVLRRIEREMEGGRRRVAGRTVAPDRFVVRLAARDIAALGPPDGAAERLASGALAFARAHGLTLRDRPRVALELDAAVEPGEVAVDAMFSPPAPPEAVVRSDSMAPAAGTRVFEVPAARAPAAVLEINELGRAPRRVPLEARPLTIGRGADCEIPLADAHVSRHHARLDVRGGVYVLTDLGSTNGLQVNGRSVREVVLGLGDRIEVGQTVLRVVATDAPPASDPPGR
jgi:hypothetical protein